MSRNWLNLFSSKHCSPYTEKHLTMNRLRDKHQMWKRSHFMASYIVINKTKTNKNPNKNKKKISQMSRM